MESQLEEGRTRAKRKMPELEASLESIAMLRKKKVSAHVLSSQRAVGWVVFVRTPVIASHPVVYAANAASARVKVSNLRPSA